MDLREILHELINYQFVPGYDRSGGPTADELRQAVDGAFNYTPPAPALTPEEQAQLAALQAKLRAVDEATAAARAGVEQAPAQG